MHPLKTYLTTLLLIRSTGANTPETSFYGPFANLLNAAGQALKPRVRCVMGLKNQGAGTPDGGLYTPDQFQRGDDEPLAGQAPARGLTGQEATEVSEMIGSIAALLLLHPALDANYAAVKAEVYPWPRTNHESHESHE